MSVSLGAAINFFVPILVFIFLFVAVFMKFKDPLSGFFNWLRGLFTSGVEKVQEGSEYTESIVYR